MSPDGELAAGPSCKQNACMPNVLIRDLPADVHATLQRRAADAGKSLQQYLSAELTALASTPTMEEVLHRISTRSGGRVGFRTAVDDLRTEREERDRR
jgi:plasmid stability protein